jgi:hypothetical protein
MRLFLKKRFEEILKKNKQTWNLLARPRRAPGEEDRVKHGLPGGRVGRAVAFS